MKQNTKSHFCRGASGMFLLLSILSCGSSSQHSVDAGMNASLAGSGGTGGSGGALGSGGAAGLDGPDASVVSTPDASNGTADANGADGALSAAAQQYVTTYAEPYCTRLAACCAQAGLAFSGLGPCEANQLSYAKYLNDGSAVIVPSAVQTLLEQMQTSCDQPSYALIATITEGTHRAGQPCEVPDQCAGTPALCWIPSDVSSGTCMTPPRGKAGDGCVFTCDDTSLCKLGTSAGRSPYSICYDQDGLRCDLATYTCVAVTAIGKGCMEYGECGTHQTCLNGTCQKRAKAGEDCGNGQQCDDLLECYSSSGGSGYACQKMPLAWSGSCSP
jgi:hypothetical protein